MNKLERFSNNQTFRNSMQNNPLNQVNMLDPQNKNSPVSEEVPELSNKTNSQILNLKILPVYREVIHYIHNRGENRGSPSLLQLWKQYAALMYLNNERERSRLYNMQSRCDIENQATKRDLMGFYGFLKYLPPREIEKLLS